MFADAVVASKDVNELILRYVHEGIFAGALALGGFIVKYPLISAGRYIKTRFAVLDAVKDELEVQRTNHLQHIQIATEAQTKVLDKVADILDDIRLDQRTLIAKIK